MSNKDYILVRLVFVALAIALILKDGFVGIIITTMMILSGLIFSQATLISMYTAHKRQRKELSKVVAERRSKAKPKTKGHKHKK